MLDLKIEKKLADFNLSMQLKTDEKLIGILGSSGSGKSMLLKCIAGLVKPDNGRIQIDQDILYDADQKIDLPIRKRRVGFLFQNYALFPNMTVVENICFGIDGEKEKKHEQAMNLIEKYYLTEIKDRYPGQISGGQQQRVALARAIASKPEIMLLDEPFSALDVHLRNRMIHEMQLFLKDFDGIALFVTHNMEEAYQLCDHIAVVADGGIESFQDKKELFKSPGSVSTAQITGCKNVSAAKKKDEQHVFVVDWGVTLKLAAKVSCESGFVGMRANQIKVIDQPEGENCLKVWMVDEAETLFKTSVFVRIDGIPLKDKDYHLHLIMVYEERKRILGNDFFIRLPAESLFFMEE
ncbi:MAG: molybdate transport system ATP-binding protein [Eubacteriaceae bacterium]|jgi:ABC-type sulfate/molybdate transport systems ATPase subunit|nr:molybdate transport system ATP-binding protein [Eubacteriaceae bacterium]